MPDAHPRESALAEFTARAVGAGLILGVLFGAANAYLGLKAGLTVSTSIPIAVLSAGLFRLLGRNGGTILETNLAQTVGSASSSLAAGRSPRSSSRSGMGRRGSAKEGCPPRKRAS